MNNFDLKKKSPRLYDVSLLVDKDAYLADIGTDHGYLPIYLVQNSIIKKAIASDVADGPLSKAKENIKLYGLEKSITTIKSNGFDKIPSDINEAVLAGMGEHLIVDIISKLKNKDITLILQANDENLEYLRRYLISNEFMIVDEKVTIEKISATRARYYEIIKAKKGHQELTDDEYYFGPINLKNKDGYFYEKYEEIYNRYNSILESFKGTESQKESKIEVINKIKRVINR